MKITTYQPAVSPSVINAPAIQAPRDINAYGGKGDGYSDITSGLGQVNKVLAKKQDDEDAANLMDAKNQIMTSLTDQLYGDNGLLTTGMGANAKGLTERVTDAVNKTSDEIMQKQNNRVAYKLKSSISENMQNFQRIAASQERQQKQVYDKGVYESSIGNNNQLAALNYDKPEFMQAQLNQNMTLIAARAQSQGWDGQTLESINRGMTTNMVSGVVMAAINNKDYDTANKALAKYKSSMDQDTYGKLNSAVNQKVEVKQMDLQARDILSQVRRPDGSYDIQKAYQLIDGINGPDAVKSNQINSKDDFFNAVGAQESGGNYNARNKSSGAFGKYQIMPANWESWKNETANAGIDVGSGDMNDPAAQEAVAKFKLGQYYDKYGAQGALVAWYAGESNAQRYVNGDSTDIWGNSWDRPQSNGPSIQGYIDQSIGRMGTTSKSAYDPEANKKLKSLFDAYAADDLRAQKEQKNEYNESIAKAMQNAGSYSGAINYLESLGDSVDMDTKNALKSSAAKYYNVTASTGRTRGSKAAYNPSRDQLILTFNHRKMQRGEELTIKEIEDGNEASERLIANGYGQGGADLNDQTIMDGITKDLAKGTSREIIRKKLKASGGSDETADFYMSLIDKSYD